MKKSFTLSVLKPCNENWKTMTPNKQGRHCAVCTKTVVDFTRKTDREIAKLIKSGNSLCGRFKKEQLDRPLTLPRKRDVFFEMVPPSYAASLLIPVAIFGTQHLKAQEITSAPTEQTTSYRSTTTSFQGQLQGKIAVQNDVSETFVLKGTISDENGPLPGANIIIKGTSRGTQTDYDGNYKIEVSNGEIIVISFIGYQTQETTVDTSKNKHINAVLKYDQIMGDIMVMGMIAEPSISHLPPKPEFSQSEERRKAQEKEKIHLEKVNEYKRYKNEQKQLPPKRNKQ